MTCLGGGAALPMQASRRGRPGEQLFPVASTDFYFLNDTLDGRVASLRAGTADRTNQFGSPETVPANVYLHDYNASTFAPRGMWGKSGESNVVFGGGFSGFYTNAGTFILEWEHTGATGGPLIYITDGTSDNVMYYDGVLNTLVVFSGGVLQVFVDGANLPTNTVHRACFSYSAGAFRLTVNGALVGTSVGSVPVAPTAMFMAYITGLTDGEVHLRRVRHSPTVFSAAQAVQATLGATRTLMQLGDSLCQGFEQAAPPAQYFGMRGGTVESLHRLSYAIETQGTLAEYAGSNFQLITKHGGRGGATTGPDGLGNNVDSYVAGEFAAFPDVQWITLVAGFNDIFQGQKAFYASRVSSLVVKLLTTWATAKMVFIAAPQPPTLVLFSADDQQKLADGLDAVNALVATYPTRLATLDARAMLPQSLFDPEDGVHWTEAGGRYVGQRIAQSLVRLG